MQKISGREIKFRAWLPGIKKMTYAHPLEELMNWGTKKEDNGTAVWLQYAELKDVDEKEVYESDIIEFAIFDFNGADTQYKGVVKFSDGQWQLWKNADDPYYGSDGPFNMHVVWYNDDGFKIIGNTYENPELLERVTK